MKLGDMLGDRRKESGVVVPVTQQSTKDLVAVRFSPLPLLPRDLLCAQSTELCSPRVRQMVLGIRIRGIGEGWPHIPLKFFDRVEASTRRRLVRAVDRHLRVEFQRLLRASESFEEGNRELSVLL